MLQEVGSLSDLPELFRQGEIRSVPGRELFDESVFDWSMDYLAKHHSKVPVNTDIKLKNGVFNSRRIDMSEFISRTDGVVGNERYLDLAEKSTLYANLNAKRILNKNLVKGDVAKLHRHQLSYMWLGMSPGTLHIDFFDNFLVQLHGQKRIIIFKTQVNDEISSKHYVNLPLNHDIPAEENKKGNPWIKPENYYDIILNPGDAVMIPNAAYHCATGITADSVSLNTFFVPKFRGGCHSPYARSDSKTPRIINNTMISLSQLYYRFTNRSLMNSNHYEIF
ncbi:MULTISPECIES: cupin-like domain-containing protein [Pseudoalteromonas]|uniref:cupin-like domain-containing protein n=1 Tax=Pseudoalteromonas TaxID=53246 RepID=UPI000F779229|nr:MULTISPECIES: cupin-like domain-containing protein [Pseudoalteromonas]MEC4087895.1 cupin-like domain-containing protein [Pseudoalteromonas rubra]